MAELPELLSSCFVNASSHHVCFLIQVNALETEGQRHNALMLLCLLLPRTHISTLRFFMCFLATVAQYSEKNKMDTPNLAVCLAPNLLHNSSKAEKMNCESKLLHVSVLHLAFGIWQPVWEKVLATG